MGRSAIEINKNHLYKISRLSLTIEDNEYDDIRIENSNSYILCQQLIKSYNLFDINEQERFFCDIKSNHFVDGIRSDKLFYNISYNDYKEILSKALCQAKKSNMHFTPRYFLCPFHRIRGTEIKTFYEYTSSIVINGIECDMYVDAGIGHIGYHDTYPGYIEIEGAKYKEVIATIPQEDLKMITVGDYKDGLFKINIIPKKFIDKIILRRKYLHPDCIEFSLEKFYTGEEDVFELDPKNPNPEVLEMMKKYRVIEERG